MRGLSAQLTGGEKKWGVEGAAPYYPSVKINFDSSPDKGSLFLAGVGRWISYSSVWQQPVSSRSQPRGATCFTGKGMRLNISQGSSAQPAASQHSLVGML